MNYIDEKFKDEKPQVTVEKIIEKLNSIGITLSEKWNDSKIDNCCSLRVTADGKEPGTNGKGVTREFARASAYGEFIERLQSGLFFYKFQSFENDESVFLHSFAPDKKYMTKEELLENSKWMEPIAKRYAITKEHIADQCAIYACSDKILTIHFYSLFEDEYVYFPAAFIEHIYGSNGCCVGNTKEEAWVHALSEILERHSNIEILKSGKPAPVIPREKLKDFKAVNAILNRIEEEGIYDVEIFDYSCGRNFPIIATRIINKKSKNYIVNCGADPVFEIAVERTLTEIFQGRNLDNFTSRNGGVILNKLSDISTIDNVTNHIETGNGLYTADFFADDSAEECKVDLFPDNADKSNTELLAQIIEIFKSINLPVYVRNYSFLGFHCYLFVVPGFSEAKGDSLKAAIPTYYFADRAAKTLRNIKNADVTELSELLMYHKMIANFISRKNNFSFLSGLPLASIHYNMASLHFAYAALKLKNYKLFNSYLDSAITYSGDDMEKDYLRAVKQWITFENNGIAKEKALAVIGKFYFKDTVKRLEKNLNDDTLLDEFLMECGDCQTCRYKDNCCYDNIRNIIKNAGTEYGKFVDGQAKENFAF